MLEAECLELLHPCVGKSAFADRLMCRGSSEEMLDRPSGAAGDDLERSHRGSGPPGFDEEHGLSREVRARQLRHAEAGGEARLPDERGIDLDAGKAPAWLGLTVVDAGVYITPDRFRRCVKSRG